MTPAGANASGGRAPLLSVCIPTYNRADFLRQCLDSFVSQTGGAAAGAVEIIVCDNASTDHTREVAAEFCERYECVSYARNDENIGVELNIFGGVARTRGEYAWIFGDDDIIAEGALGKLLSRLSGGGFDFLMMNKTVKNKDLTVTLLERQNDTAADITFPGIAELCCEFGYFTQLGFISTAVFRRAPFLRVDYTPYLNTYFPQNGVWLEAFHERPCLYVSDALVVQRQDNQRVDQRSAYYILSVYALRTFKALVSRGVLDYSVIERIKERPLGRAECTAAEFISFYLVKIVREGGVVYESEWLDIFEAYFGLPSRKYRELALNVFADYLLKRATDYVVGTAGKDFSLQPDAETVEDEALSRFGAGAADGDGLVRRFILDNERVAGVKGALENYHGLMRTLTARGRAERVGLQRWVNFSKLTDDLPRLAEELSEVTAGRGGDGAPAYGAGALPDLEQNALNPRLVEENYRGDGATYNIVHWMGDYYAIPVSLGPVDLPRLDRSEDRYRDIVLGKSVKEVKTLVARRPRKGRAS